MRIIEYTHSTNRVIGAFISIFEPTQTLSPDTKRKNSTYPKMVGKRCRDQYHGRFSSRPRKNHRSRSSSQFKPYHQNSHESSGTIVGGAKRAGKHKQANYISQNTIPQFSPIPPKNRCKTKHHYKRAPATLIINEPEEQEPPVAAFRHARQRAQAGSSQGGGVGTLGLPGKRGRFPRSAQETEGKKGGRSGRLLLSLLLPSDNFFIISILLFILKLFGMSAFSRRGRPNGGAAGR